MFNVLKLLKVIVKKIKGTDKKIKDIDNKLTSYIHNESVIQEKTATLTVKNKLMDFYPYAKIKEFPLREFYVPKSNNMRTDLDGCITIKSSPIKVPNKNGNPVKLHYERAYIIEAKHNYTKALIDTKLKQFCDILDAFRLIKNRKQFNNTPISKKFKEMVLNYNLEDFPSEIYFIFVSDIIPNEQQEFLLAINSGEINENIYNKYLLEYVKTHPLINDIINDKDVAYNVKNVLKNTENINDIYDIFSPGKNNTNTINTTSIKNNKTIDDIKLNRDDIKTISTYKKRMNPLLIPYDDVEYCYSVLKGKIGFMYHNKLILPYEGNI